MFLYSKWMILPIATRYKIAEAFGIQKKKSIHTVNNQVVDDGFYIQDVESALTAEHMRAFTEIKSDDLNVLLQATIDKIEGKEVALPEPLEEVKLANEIENKTINEIIETKAKTNAKIKKTK